jgi:hypothetical protein
MEDAIALLAIALLANKIIELLKYLKSKNWNGAITLVSLFIAGVVALNIAAHAAVTEHTVIPGTGIELGLLDFMSLLLLGLLITAGGSTIYDFKKAFDGSDTAKQPALTNMSHGDPPTNV